MHCKEFEYGTPVNGRAGLTAADDGSVAAASRATKTHLCEMEQSFEWYSHFMQWTRSGCLTYT